MTLLDVFISRKKNTANVAKERLQVIIAESHHGNHDPYYLPQLRKDILEVVCKYVQIDPAMVTLQVKQKNKNISILALNVTLLETKK